MARLASQLLLLVGIVVGLLVVCMLLGLPSWAVLGLIVLAMILHGLMLEQSGHKLRRRKGR